MILCIIIKEFIIDLEGVSDLECEIQDFKFLVVFIGQVQIKIDS